MDDYNFFSIDKLVEFGLGMAISKQMVDIMNQTISKTNIAGAMNSIQSENNSDLYYFIIEGKSSGPFCIKEIIILVQQKKINKDTLTWMPSMLNWDHIKNVPILLKYIALQPPKVPNNSTFL
jgi:hypothetical protein